MNGFWRTLFAITLLAAAGWIAAPIAAQESGEIRIVQIVCEGEGKHTLEIIGVSEEAEPLPESCTPGENYLSDYLYLSSPAATAGVEPQPGPALADTEVGVVVLPVAPGEQFLGDPFDSTVSLTVTVAAGETVTVRSVVYTGATDDPTGDLQIVKILCDAEGAPIIREVESPEEATALPDGCFPGESEFGVREFPSPEEPAILSTDPVTGTASASFQPGTYEVVDMSDPMVHSILVEIVAGETVSLQSIDYAVDRAPELCGEGLGVAEPGDGQPLAPGGPQLRWSIPLAPTAMVSALLRVDDSTVALKIDSMDSSVLYGIDAATGASIWCQDLGGMQFGAPMTTDGVVVAVTEPIGGPGTGGTIGYDGATGEELWRIQPGLMAGFAPSIGGDGTVVGNDFETMQLSAIDVASGQERWQHAGDSPGFPGMTMVADGMVFAESATGTGVINPVILALDASSGQERWQVELGSEGGARPVAYADSTLFVWAFLGNTSFIVALNAESGEERWRAEINGFEPRPIAVNGALYIAGSPGLIGLDAATGTPLWEPEESSFPPPGQTAPVVLADQILMIDALGSGTGSQSELAGFDPTTGAELWRIPLGPPDMPISPVAAGGAVFVVGNDLLALEPA